MRKNMLKLKEMRKNKMRKNMLKLKNRLIHDTDLIFVEIRFDENLIPKITYTPGIVNYTSNDKLNWSSTHTNNRTLLLRTFGQILPSVGYKSLKFYGLFFPEDVTDNNILNLIKMLRQDLIMSVKALNIVSDHMIKSIPKPVRYLELKYNRKYGNSSWHRRPYHIAKNDSRFDMFIINYRDGKRFEERRADRIIYKDVKKKTWNKNKYPKLYKKFIDNLPVEYFVLKKDKWRV